MKKIGMLVMALCLSVGVMGQNQTPNPSAMNISGPAARSYFNQMRSMNTATPFSSLRSDFSVDFSEDFASSILLKFHPEQDNTQWGLILKNDLGTNNKYTPILSKDRWAIDNALDLSYFRHVYTGRHVFTDDLEAELASNGSDTTAAYDAIEARGDLSGFSTIWLTGGVQWNYNDFLVLKDSLFVGMEDPFNSTNVHGVTLSAKFNGLRTLSFRNGFQISGGIGYAYTFNGNNYGTLDEVEVFSGTMARDTINGFISESEPAAKGSKGTLVIADAHTITGEFHMTWNNPRSRFAGDLFVNPELTIIDGTEVLNIQAGVNFAVPNRDGERAAINIGIGIKFKNATVPYEDVEDRQKRLIPMIMLGVPIPDIGG
jgi:hypothetical protein